MKNPNHNLAELFLQFFDVAIAKTEEEKHRSYQLRYQTYCHDFGYIDPSVYPEQIEKDEFDGQATHCLVTHKATGQLVGSVRCLRPNWQCDVQPHLPFEHICKDSVLAEHQDSIKVPRQSMLEISRITVNQAFRNLTCEKVSDLEKQLAQHTSGILAICAYAVATKHDIKDGFAIMESFLARRLTQMGIPCHRRGKDMKFYGIRALYYLDVQQIGKAMPEKLQQFVQPIRKLLY